MSFDALSLSVLVVVNKRVLVCALGLRDSDGERVFADREVERPLHEPVADWVNGLRVGADLLRVEVALSVTDPLPPLSVWLLVVVGEYHV